MKIEMGNSEFFIFLDKLYIECDYNDKKSIGEAVRDYLFHYSNFINIRGFYKVKVYSNREFGLFIEGKCLEKSSDKLDLKILVFLDEEVFVSCYDYFLLEGDCYFYNNCFYSKDYSISNLDFYDYVYGDRVLEIKNRGLLIKKESN